ncbi:pyridoxamine 5'-phosphate oxidase family protein [Maritimibacter alkaliphilus]|uniref:pyridoxamine 5'-phosphate oxidase family protein n=1 Tax=Maritimibacter alkaliphilus TaxID=404236 RepID=UPI001C9819F7|nr:pyridoxamine 5'-phosphate oxidase family protein [Maritimibacter alkaliphilus]MBY6090158.1 pyridoxamine 5'-phosphate oxidase family protein [Maritimibacter alkaliphilus]
MSRDLKSDFWKGLGDTRAGLLAAGGEQPVPMAPHADAEAGVIWFITAQGTAADRAARASGTASFHVADSRANLYANVRGRLEVSDDPKKLDEIWSAVASAWFENGRKDSAVRLLRMTPEEAEVWSGDGGASFLYEIAKAKMTGDTPDVGDHGRLIF